MSEAPALPVAPKSRRLEFIDLLRGWAVIVMIETHVMNATLTGDIAGSGPFQLIKFINGLVAPSFLFASGLAYAVTTRRKLHDYLSFGPPLFKQIRRLLFVVMIGYLLHLPKFNYKQILESTERSWQVFFQADVLQCIGVSLLIIQVLLLVLRSERRLYFTLAGLTIAIAFITPVMWGIDFWSFLPMPLAGYMNGIRFPNYRGFPLFPWSAFLFAGAILGYFYNQAKEKGKSGSPYNETVMMKRVLWIAPVIMVVSFAIEPLAAMSYPVYDYWMFSPSFFLLRLGLVMLFCAGLFFYEKWKTVSPRSPITLIGRESLLVYSVHLLLIYGNFASFNFQKSVNHTYGYTEAWITTLVLFALMYLLALAWDRLRKGEPAWKRRVEIGIALFLVGVFFFGPGQ